jgi:site-specific recombinase XerC
MLDSISSAKPPKTLTLSEVNRLLEKTLTYGETPMERFIALRDHTILLLAIMVGLREHEITALTIGDTFDIEQRARETLALRVFKGCERDGGTQEVFLPLPVREALDSFLRLKHAARESIAPHAPLFAGRKGAPLSLRQVRHLFHVWQERAGFEARYNFHMLRHTACTAVYEQSRDLRATQVFARHKKVQTTVIYTHPSRETLMQAVSAAAAVWGSPAGRRWQVRR